MMLSGLSRFNEEDMNRLLRNEEALKNALTIHRVPQLPNFPYKDLHEVRAARETGDLALCFFYRADLLEEFGSKAEIIIHHAWLTVPGLTALAYLCASFLTGDYYYLFGLFALLLGFFGSSPALRFLVLPIVILAWLPALFLISSNFVWTAAIGGIYGGYIPTAIARTYLSKVLESRALLSEVILCYFYQIGALVFFQRSQSRYIAYDR